MFLRFGLSALLSALLAPAGWAGGEVPAPAMRKQFRQTSTYPYIFQPDCYLATTGPAPLRFTETANVVCGQRFAPPLTGAAKGLPKPASTPPPVIPPPAEPRNTALYPPPETTRAESQTAGDAVDFSRTPDEVMEFFRTTDGKAGKRIYLFDPIFQPAKPHDLPKSKATYVQKP